MKSETDHGGVEKQQSDRERQVVSSVTTIDNNLPPSKSSALKGKLCFKTLRKFVYRFLRGFANGMLLHLAVEVVTALLRNRFRKGIPKIRHAIFTKDSLRVALFCALYPSIYHLLVEILSVLQKHQNGWTFGISGGVAGLSLAFLKTSMRQTLAFFAFPRALASGLSTLVRKGFVPDIPYFEVGVFCASGCLLSYCFLHAPWYLNPGYYKSLLTWVQVTDGVLRSVYREPGTRFVTCQEYGLHKESCLQHWINGFLYSMPGFAKLYLPIHLIPVIVFRTRTLIDKPLHTMKSVSKNLAMSTLFLASMISLGKGTLCLLRNIAHRPAPCPAYVSTVAGAVCCLAILLERSSRRKELVLFIIPQVMYVIYNFARQFKLWPRFWLFHGLTLLFVFSMATVMHAYETEPGSLMLLVKCVLKCFVGSQ